MVSVRNSKKRFEKGENLFSQTRERRREKIWVQGAAASRQGQARSKGQHQHKKQLSTMVQITNI